MKLSCYLPNCDCSTVRFVINSSAPWDSSTDREEESTGVENLGRGTGGRGETDTQLCIQARATTDMLTPSSTLRDRRW